MVLDHISDIDIDLKRAFIYKQLIGQTVQCFQLFFLVLQFGRTSSICDLILEDKYDSA